MAKLYAVFVDLVDRAKPFVTIHESEDAAKLYTAFVEQNYRHHMRGATMRRVSRADAVALVRGEHDAKQ